MTLTKGDLKKVEELIDKKLDSQKKNIVTEVVIKVVSEVANHVDHVFEKYRNEMNEKFDPIIKEIQTEPQERTILNNRLEEHEDRITVLEVKAGD